MATAPKRLTFPGHDGTALAARLDLPAAPPKAYALFAHCFTCSKDIFAAGRIAAELTARRIAVLRFDFTGLGASEGDFANTDFSSNLEDLEAAAAWLRAEHSAPQLLIGHSLGGAAVVAVAARIPEVRAVATIGAPADIEHVTNLFADDLDEIEQNGAATVDIVGRGFTVRREFVDDLARHSVEERAGELKRPLLILHSPIDGVVGIDNAARLFEAARHPKSFISLDGADHLLTDHDDATYAAAMIGTWASRYVVDEHPTAPPTRLAAPVVVAEAGQGKFLNHVVIGRHGLFADEPVSSGGFDAGPSPYDFLAAGLGACTSMTLRLYAEHKQLELGRVTVGVSHDKVHADDCETCIEDRDGKIDRFQRTIIIDDELDEATRESLLRIAEKCPVHCTLESHAQIDTTIEHP